VIIIFISINTQDSKKGVGDSHDRREKADPNTNKKTPSIKDGVFLKIFFNYG
jgi:hypothetical protein